MSDMLHGWVNRLQVASPRDCLHFTGLRIAAKYAGVQSAIKFKGSRHGS